MKQHLHSYRLLLIAAAICTLAAFWLLGARIGVEQTQRQVDVVNISLGYTVFDDFDGYTPQMLDGRTALCSRFLDSLLDAHPRMVVVQSAGNEGKNKWRHISFPGDVAEAVTVGAADSEGTGRSGKSGTGYYPHPVKPDLVVYDSPNGTSFSTPVS